MSCENILPNGDKKMKNKKTALTILLIAFFLFISPCHLFALESSKNFISSDTINAAINKLLDKYGEKEAFRIKRGITQVAEKWRNEDGNELEFTEFCLKNFITDKKTLEDTFNIFKVNFETINGHLHAIGRQMNWPIDVNTGDILAVEYLFAEYSPFAHLDDDLFKTKVAFMALLNFPIYTLEEKLTLGSSWSREDWAKARLADKFISRVPAEVNQKLNKAYLKADDYINSYNIYMHNIVDENKKNLFPQNLTLISHWGLRDYLKGLYAEREGLPLQKTIALIMERIINQEIPENVINNPKIEWNPINNKVYADDEEISAKPEPDTRYKKIIDIFKAERLLDNYCPEYPSLIDRRFKLDREIPEEHVEKLLVSILASPAVKKAANLIEKRLGRKLEPFDIWYDGFKYKAPYSTEELDKIVTERYPNVETLQKDIPNLLKKLGFSEDKANFLTAHIQIDPARGAGHAQSARMREDKAHLRTRFCENGLNFEGFDTTCHELGHCVEQVFSMTCIDHTLLSGVPNSACTEAFAFLFQGRRYKLLELPVPNNSLVENMNALQTLWDAYEICGVGLLDMKIWQWLYKHPDANERELKEAVISLSKEIWNKYYAPVIGVKDSDILAIYSHIVCYGMYTPDYPLGHIIQFQFEQYFKTNDLAKETERICELGLLTPDFWMKSAVGDSISTKPLLDAAEEALKTVNK